MGTWGLCIEALAVYPLRLERPSALCYGSGRSGPVAAGWLVTGLGIQESKGQVLKSPMFRTQQLRVPKEPFPTAPEDV